MKIKLSPRADRDLEQAVDYLISKNPSAAHKFADVLELAFSNLTDNPHLGRATNMQDIRCLIITLFRYKIFYRIDGELIIVEAIFHTSQNPSRI